MYQKILMKMFISSICLLITLLFSANVVSAQESCSILFKSRPNLTLIINYNKFFEDWLNPKDSQVEMDAKKLAGNSQLTDQLQTYLRTQLVSTDTSSIKPDTAHRLYYGLALLAKIRPDTAADIALEYLNSDKIKTNFFTSKAIKEYKSFLDTNVSFLVIFNLLSLKMSSNHFLSIMKAINQFPNLFKSLMSGQDVNFNISFQIYQLATTGKQLSDSDIQTIQNIVLFYFNKQSEVLSAFNDSNIFSNTGWYIDGNSWSLSVTMAYYLKAIAMNSNSQFYQYYDRMFQSLLVPRIYQKNKHLLPPEVSESIESRPRQQNVIHTITETNG